MKLNNKGFTLVEVLAVVVIMSILIAIMVPNINYLIEKQRDESLKSIAKSINSATKIYLSDNKDEIDVNDSCTTPERKLNISKGTEIDSCSEGGQTVSCIKVSKLIELGNLKDMKIKNPNKNNEILDPNTSVHIYYSCAKKDLLFDELTKESLNFIEE